MRPLYPYLFTLLSPALFAGLALFAPALSAQEGDDEPDPFIVIGEKPGDPAAGLGLHDARPEGGCDDTGQTSPRTELQHARTSHGARCHFMRERYGRGPQRDPIRQSRLISAQKALFIFVTENCASVQDRPRLPAEREAVLLERKITDCGGEYLGWCLGGHGMRDGPR